jgi:hypothetical protein
MIPDDADGLLQLERLAFVPFAVLGAASVFYCRLAEDVGKGDSVVSCSGDAAYPLALSFTLYWRGESLQRDGVV